MLKNSRGVSNIGCLLTLAVIVAGCYVGYRFSVVQWNLEAFKEQMTEVTRFFANEPNLENVMAIKNDVIRRAGSCGFSLEPEDITVKTDGPSITITAAWTEQIIFPGGFIYHRDIEVSRTIKKLGN